MSAGLVGLLKPQLFDCDILLARTENDTHGCSTPATFDHPLAPSMSALTISLISITCYLVASVLIWRSAFFRRSEGVNQKAADPNIGNQIPKGLMASSQVAALLALCAHIFYAWNAGFGGATIDLSLDSMVALVSISVVTIFLCGSLALQIHQLGILVYPLAAFCVAFSILWQGANDPISDQPLYPFTLFSLHIIVSVLAYSLLAIATLQALLYSYQERQIKAKTKPTMLAILPPLQTMETLLFRLCWMGFGLLTLTLLSGAIFSQQIFGQAFAIKHHTVLALAGWLVIAIMLIKHHRHGLNGSQASIWLIGGFLLVQLGYFGTKIVNESLKLV